jgi:hypothetical protein
MGRLTLNAGVRYDRYTGWLPEQEQLAFSLGPVNLDAKTFPEQHLYTWNLFAPRIGVIFDLTGDGRTVVKANYGYFWHNPGVAPGDNANPNTSTKQVTYQWTDLNGDRRWQPGEEGSITSQALEGAIQLDPDLESPYTHEGAVWLERQFTDVLGVRAGFVYKTEDNLIDTDFQPFRVNGYTQPFPFVDIGLDGLTGTADDRELTLLGLPSSLASEFPATSVVMNTGRYSRAKTIEVSMSKRYGNRWSASIGGAHTWLTDFPEDEFPKSPNEPGAQDQTLWNMKLTATYDAAWGIRFSPVLRHQSGDNYARELTIRAPSGLIASGTAYADSFKDNREDNIWVFDLRTEKTVNFTERVRTRLFLDLFNITNSHASETISHSTGLGFRKPSAILAPFTARLGFRFLW